MGTHKSHTAEYESPKLRVVDLPIMENRLAPNDYSVMQQGQPRRRKSKYVGIYQARKSWKAEITKDHHRHYLGAFTSQIGAARAYDQKAIELYGEYARTNQMIYPEDFS